MQDDQTTLGFDSDEPLVCRSVWISDIHLGTKHARVEELLEFLRVVDCKYLYIVGDFIDGWELKFRWFWRDDYNVLIQKLLRKSRKQTKVIYITGNHDEFIDQFAGNAFWQRDHGASGDPHRRRREKISRHPRPSGGRPDAFQSPAGKARLAPLQLDSRFQSVFQPPAPRAGFRLLVAGGVSEIQGQVRREIRHRIRGHAGLHGAQPPGRRRHLRPHPPRRDEDD